MRSFRVSSVVRAAPEAVWEHATTIAGVNEAVEPGRGFRERSRLGSCSTWHHDRTLSPVAAGTRIVDEVAFTPRLRATGGLLTVVFAATFRWRHRRLRRMWR